MIKLVIAVVLRRYCTNSKGKILNSIKYDWNHAGAMSLLLSNRHRLPLDWGKRIIQLLRQRVW